MATSLLDWIMTLMKDTEAREAFQADPKGAMSAAGMSSICGSDIRDARPFLLDNPSVKQVRPYEPAEAKEPADQIRQIVENHKFADSGPDHVAREDYVAHHASGGPEIEDSYHKRVDESYNRSSADRFSDDDDVTGPASGPKSAAADQGGSTVGNNQSSIGGEKHVIGDNNDSSVTDSSTDNRDFGNDITGDGSAGRDINQEQGGAVFGQGIAGGDMDHVGGLIGVKDVVDIGGVNVLSGIANLNDILNNSLNDPAQDIFGDNSPIANDLLSEGIHDLDLSNVLQGGVVNLGSFAP
jgi:hypothetical protein